MTNSNDELMMETMYWWGIPTLFRCENRKDISNCDIALVGVPHSTGNGTTERDQHLGPRAVRNVSAGLRRVHLDFNINPWKEKKIFDLGDVALPHANNNERCIEDITNFYTNISKENGREGLFHTNDIINGQDSNISMVNNGPPDLLGDISSNQNEGAVLSTIDTQNDLLQSNHEEKIMNE